MSQSCHQHASRRNGFYYDESFDDFVFWNRPTTLLASTQRQQDDNGQLNAQTYAARSHQRIPESFSRELSAHGEQSVNTEADAYFSHSHAMREGQTECVERQTLDHPEGIYAQRYWADGLELLDVWDSRSRVRSRFGLQPAEYLTDPDLLKDGIRARRLLLGTGGDSQEERFPDYHIQSESFYRIGQVFSVLWADCVGDMGSMVGFAEDGVMAHKIRRFVVIKESVGCCSALPILTYGLQGVAKPGVRKETHAIIFTGRSPPDMLPNERPERREAGMRAIAIRVVPDSPHEKLDARSRIDFGKVHTIADNIKAKSFGRVHPEHLRIMWAQFSNVWGHQTF